MSANAAHCNVLCFAGAESEGPGNEANKAEGVSPAQTPKPLEKPAEVIAFEAGKEIMDLLRSKHPHSTGALELMMSEIGLRLLFAML
jgi:hypothetical protein